MPDVTAPATGRPPVEQLLTSARELRFDERFTEALSALDRAMALSPSGEQLRLIQAEQARLAYYVGNFEDGVRLADEVLSEGQDLAAARAGLAASVNLMALNRAHDALAAISLAQLRLRVARARGEDLADALIQLAHVQAHMGSHGAAVETGRAAVRLTGSGADGERLRGRALCALGLVLSYAGDDDALEALMNAERAERTRSASLWHWTQFCIAAYLRDRGYAPAAAAWLGRSGVSIGHELAWFAIRSGDISDVNRWLRSHVRGDERPFARCVLAALRTASGNARAAPAALRAADEFTRLGMQHWSWGARWIAAADPQLAPVRRGALVGNLIDELEERSSLHWGFFDPASCIRVLRITARYGLPQYAERIRAHVEAWSAPARYEDGALLGALSLLKAEALSSLADAGLTLAEVRGLVVVLELWLEGSDPSRAALADRLHARESSVRSLISEIRAKLGIRGRRGVEPLIAWLAERDLLAPATATSVIRRLTS